MAEKKNIPLNLFAISILALAASLTYFTFEISQFLRQVPDILENIRTTSEKVEPVLEEMNQIRDLIPPILAEVSATREQIPAILDEVKAVREIIPSVLIEAGKTRQQLPAVLDGVAAVSEQLPSILTSVDSVSAEMKAYRPLVSEALVQVEGTRKEIPVMLTRVDSMIDKAQAAAKEASSGLVSGAIGGLLTAPFRLAGDFGSSVLGLSMDETDNFTDEDISLLYAHGKDLLTSGKQNDYRNWNNFDANQRFRISLLKIYSKNNMECRDLHLQTWSASKPELNKNIKLCLNDKGEWQRQ